MALGMNSFSKGIDWMVLNVVAQIIVSSAGEVRKITCSLWMRWWHLEASWTCWCLNCFPNWGPSKWQIYNLSSKAQITKFDTKHITLNCLFIECMSNLPLAY